MGGHRRVRFVLILIRVLAVLGAIAIFLATAQVVLGFGFICIDTCPPDETIPNFVVYQLLGPDAEAFLPVLALLIPAWVLCLAFLVRAHELWWALGVGVAPAVGGALAVGIMLLAGHGTLVPTTVAAFDAWTGGLIWAGTALLLWPVAILVASRRLGPRSGRIATDRSPSRVE